MAKKKDESTTRQRSVQKVAWAMVKAGEAKFWRPMLGILGLDGEETVERLTRLLVIHLLLDRALTAVITMNFLNSRVSSSFKKLEEVLASLPLSRRIEIAEAAQLISTDCARRIKSVNRVRNKLAHYQPKLGFDMTHVQELSSPKAFDRCVGKGKVALDEVIKAFARNGDEVSPKL